MRVKSPHRFDPSHRTTTGSSCSAAPAESADTDGITRYTHEVKAPAKQITAFKLDVDILDAMRRLQKRDGISLSEQARRALRPWLVAEGILKGQRGMSTATWRKRM